MKAPFDELVNLVIAMCADAIFWRLIILITVVALLLLLAEVHCTIGPRVCFPFLSCRYA